MRDDTRQDDKPEEPAADDEAVQAFNAMRRTVETQGADLGAEMTVLRRGVEAAFDQFEKFQAPIDYSPDLGRIAKQLAAVKEGLERVEHSPILRNGPEHYARALERSGESLIRTAAQQLECQARDLERVGGTLAAYSKSAHDRKSQDLRIWMAGGAGIIAGILLTLFLPRVLPFSADTYIAGAVMGDTRWDAGSRMMEAGHPDWWHRLRVDWRLVEDNTEAITKCRQAAQKAKKDQRCTITVKPIVQ